MKKEIGLPRRSFLKLGGITLIGMLGTATSGSAHSLPYFSRDVHRRLSEDFPKGIVGIAVSISADKIGDPSGLFVTGIFPGSPAEKAGIEQGDQIISVDGNSIQGKNYEEVVKLIRGEPNTTVQLVIKRKEEEKTFTLTRVSGTEMRKKHWKEKRQESY